MSSVLEVLSGRGDASRGSARATSRTRTRWRPAPVPVDCWRARRHRAPVISSSRWSDMEWFGREPTGSIKSSVAPLARGP